LATTSIS